MKNVKCEIFTKVLLKILIFWDVTLCQMVNNHKLSEGS